MTTISTAYHQKQEKNHNNNDNSNNNLSFAMAAKTRKELDALKIQVQGVRSILLDIQSFMKDLVEQQKSILNDHNILKENFIELEKQISESKSSNRNMISESPGSSGIGGGLGDGGVGAEGHSDDNGCGNGSCGDGQEGCSNSKTCAELLLDIQERVAKIEKEMSVSMESSNHPIARQEQILRDKKKNNLIVFGLSEVQDNMNSDNAQTAMLLQDLGLKAPCNTIHSFRVGKYDSERKRPMVVKFEAFEQKMQVLRMAKNLKGNGKWTGVALTHDLTKSEYQQEKAREMELQRAAVISNNHLSEDEKKLMFWKVVGGRGNRHLIQVVKQKTDT